MVTTLIEAILTSTNIQG